MSVSREAVACYRLYAANCVELAEHIPDLDRRVFLLNMARDWLKMADQAERHDGAGRTEEPSARAILIRNRRRSLGLDGRTRAPRPLSDSRACGYRLGWQRPRNQPILRMPSSPLLSDPATYGGGAVRRCETHAAVVFLAGDRVLKVKRAVRYPFLDYSTLDKRKAACQAELDVNRKFAPQLYRRIVPIVRQADGSLALDGAGAAIEWAVEMTRFDEDKTLDHLAERGELDEALAAKLAIAVAAMHGRAERVEAAPGSRPSRNSSATTRRRSARTATCSRPDAVDELERKSQAALGKIAPAPRRARRAGLIRRGHGDLHLGNIAVLDGEPVAFDALEFDPDHRRRRRALRSGVSADGFDRTRAATAGEHRVERLFSASRRDEDCDGIAALPFFMSLRAAIRAKVTAARRDLAAAADQADLARSAQRYFDLALELLIPTKPTIACTGGLSGTGKSMLARALAPPCRLRRAPWCCARTSNAKRFSASPSSDRLPAGAYRPEISETIYRRLTDKAERVAHAGHSVVVDAVFAKPQERAAIEAAAEAAKRISADCSWSPICRHASPGSKRAVPMHPMPTPRWHACRMSSISATVTWTIVDASGSPEQTLASARAALFARATASTR